MPYAVQAAIGPSPMRHSARQLTYRNMKELLVSHLRTTIDFKPVVYTFGAG